MPLADAQQLDADARKRRRILRNHAIGVVIHADKAGNRRAALDDERAQLTSVPLSKRHRAYDAPILRVRAEIALRQRDADLVFARQNARQPEGARFLRQHDEGLLFTTRGKGTHFHIQAAKALQRAVRAALDDRTANLGRIDAARIDHIIRVVAVDDHLATLAIARILHAADGLLGADCAAGEGDIVRCVKSYRVYTCGYGFKPVSALCVRAAGFQLVARAGDERHRHARIASGLHRIHHAIRIVVKEHYAGNTAVAPCGNGGKAPASRRSKRELGMALPLQKHRLATQRQLIDEGSGHLRIRRKLHLRLGIRAHVKRHASWREAAAGNLLARLRIHVSHAHSADIIRHIGQTHCHRPLERLRHARIGGLPAAVRKAVLHAGSVDRAYAVTCSVQLHTAHIQARAVLCADGCGQARQGQGLSTLKRAAAHADEGQPLLLRRIQLLDHLHLSILRHTRAAHERLGDRSALRQIRLHDDFLLGLHAKGIARSRLRLPQQIGAHSNSHAVGIGFVRHVKGEHGLLRLRVHQLI